MPVAASNYEFPPLPSPSRIIRPCFRRMQLAGIALLQCPTSFYRPRAFPASDGHSERCGIIVHEATATGPMPDCTTATPHPLPAAAHNSCSGCTKPPPPARCPTAPPPPLTRALLPITHALDARGRSHRPDARPHHGHVLPHDAAH